MRKRETIEDQAARDGELVPIVGSRLLAAITHRGLSNRQLATILRERGKRFPALRGIKGRSIDYMATGNQERCRESVRSMLSQVLEQPEWWLAGEPPPIADSAWRRHVTDELRRKDELIDAPAAWLARREVLGKISKAWRRDLYAGKIPSPTWPRPDWTTLPAKDRIVLFEELFFPLLVSPWHWRHVVLAYSATVHRETIPFFLLPEDADRIALGLAGAIGALLQPWFQGKAPLNHRLFYQALYWLRDVPPPGAEHLPPPEEFNRASEELLNADPQFRAEINEILSRVASEPIPKTSTSRKETRKRAAKKRRSGNR